MALELEQSFINSGNNSDSLPKLPTSVGGDTDIMIWAQYLKYFPDQFHKLPCGLTLFKSQFRSFDDTRGVVAGPHESFSELFNMRVHHVFYTDEAKLYLNDVQHEFGLRDMRESDSVFDRFCIYNSSFSLPGEGDDSDDGFDDGFTHNTYKCDGDGNIKPDISNIACECKSGSKY